MRAQIICAALAIALIRPFASAQWVQTTGPLKINVTSIAVRDTNLVAGTYGGGVFLSPDTGTSWIAASTGLTNLNVTSLASNDSMLFAGTGGGGVFFSTDNGTSWTQLYNQSGLTSKNVAAVVAPQAGERCFAATSDSGVYNFTPVPSPLWTPQNTGLTNLHVSAFALTPAGGGPGSTNIFAGTSGGGVFVLPVNTTPWTWTLASAGLVFGDSVYSFAISGTHLFLGTGTGVFLSTNSGASWTQLGTTGLTNHYVYSLAVSGSSLFAGTRGGGVFRATSANNFSSWTAVDSGLTSPYVSSLAVSGAYLFAGTSYGVWRRPLSEMIPVSVTVGTNPVGLSFSVDGSSYSSTQTFSWTSPSVHTIAATSPQSGGTGTQYVFSNWSDGGGISHTITTPTSNITYTATFTTRYFLTMTAGSGGTVSPASGWQNSGQSVQISASPNVIYTFSGWTGSGTGSYSGLANPDTVTMNGPISETGSFAIATGDTIYVPGGTLAMHENAGSLETAINGDKTALGVRNNPNRVYALNQGQYYFQLAPINCYNPTGTLTICGVPSKYGKTKPIILIAPTPPATSEGTNTVYGSIKCDGIHYQAQMLTGLMNAELFYCGTANNRPQSLTINNCLFEFSWVDLFDCTNETGAIGGWPYGAKFRITNSYFRNLFRPDQWWGSRVFQCKHPIDTLWIENCTVTTGGLTFLQYRELADFMYINHNTIVNNKKYWLLSPYHKSMFITNNIFINQNWTGEDTNVVNSGQDPDKYLEGTINVDTNNATNGLIVQGKYYVGDSSHYSPLLALDKLQVYVSDNINYYDPLLSSGYYNSSKYKNATLNALPSYLTWSFSNTPYPIRNVPGRWMNSRTLALFAAYGPPNGGFIEKRTSTANPGTVTSGIANASVVDSMAVWSQGLWGDPRFLGGAALQNTAYIYGDYNPLTLPGIVNGVKTDTMTTGAAGITKFTDLTENFSQSGFLSAIDGLPIGALIWDDAKLAGFSSASDWTAVYAKYLAEGGRPTDGIQSGVSGVPVSYSLAQNYPNPFNPSTTIKFELPTASHTTLSVYDILGREVSVLVNERKDAGFHEVKFDGSNLASGVYFYRLHAGEFVQTRKLVILK